MSQPSQTKLTKANIFLISCCAFIVGVGIFSFAAVPIYIAITLACVGIIILTVSWPNRKGIVIGLIFISIGLGFIRSSLTVPQVTPGLIQYYNGQPVEVVGIISGEPDVRTDHVKLTVDVRQGTDTLPQTMQGKILVNTPLYPAYQYGDVIKLRCTPQTPEPITDEETGRTFYYDKYLARYNIYSLCYRPQITLLASAKGDPLMHGMLAVKHRFVQAVQQSLPEPQASFLGGLILGAKKAIPDDIMEQFNRTGTTHIVALSGYNITIIAVLVLNLCKYIWISRRGAFWVSLGAITFFVLITGAQASVVRAGIMGMLVLLATQIGRASRITNTLVLAAVVMLLVNPRVLVFDAGFQLSFLATIGLVYISPVLERFFTWLPSTFEIRASMVATLSATLMTLPLIVYQFGRLSLVAPIVNVLILPAIPIAMGAGFIMGILALLWPVLGSVCGWLVWTILSYILYVVEQFSRLSVASFDMGVVSWWWLVIGYGLILFNMIVLIQNKRKYQQYD